MNSINQQKNIFFINDGMTKNVVATVVNSFICCVSYGVSLSFFGMIAGIIGVYHSNQVKSMQMMDNQIGAQSSANSANLWGNISIGLLVFNLFLILILIFIFGVVLFEEMYYYY